jgi:uncharacterized protein YlbG (UPF0298 family)
MDEFKYTTKIANCVSKFGDIDFMSKKVNLELNLIY